MSQHAKSVIAAFVAVVYVGITAWQTLGDDGFTAVDIIPLAVILAGAIQTHVVPNLPELPWAKAVVSGTAAVLSALATLVAQDPAGVTVSKLLTAGAGAFLVWFVPEFGYAPAPAAISDDGAAHVVTDSPAATPETTPAPDTEEQEITDALRQLDALDRGDPAATSSTAAAPPADGLTPTYDAVAAHLAAVVVTPSPLVDRPPVPAPAAVPAPLTQPMATVAAGTPAA